MDDDEGDVFKEDMISRYFRNYHSPVILSMIGKVVVFILFTGLLAFGFYGAFNLDVEDTSRNFIPSDSYLQDYFDASDNYFPSEGIDLFITFEGQSNIYSSRQELAELDSRLTGLSQNPPYIAEPVSEEAYRNVMTGLHDYLVENGSANIGGVPLGDDQWPTSEEDLVATLVNYTSFNGPGDIYSNDLSIDDNGNLQAYQVKCEYVRLTKNKKGDVIDDAGKLIDAMDETRDLIESWTDLQPSFPYSAKFIEVEGFKIIRRELFQNVGLAILAVGVIVFLTMANFLTALLVTLNVAFAIIEILGVMWSLGIVIDSVSVINITLAVGLSVDYAAHVGHAFLTKSGDKDSRALESLADVGAAVLSGALSTFLAVVVLLFSSSYVFVTLSRQFALTVALGIAHGLVLLPVMLSLIGPQPYKSVTEKGESDDEPSTSKPIAETGHGASDDSSDGNEKPHKEGDLSSDDKGEQGETPAADED